jgi:4-hydroxy-tetrahydrodipicolinate reductase
VPFQQKIGAGLTEHEFSDKEDSLRHIGLPESVYLVADAFGWQLDKVEEVLTPVLAKEDIELDWTTIGKSKMTGVRQVATGYVKGKEVITLDFKAAIDLERSYDKIEIKGEPGFSSGINGDIATSAIIVNAVRSIVRTEAGLKTMLDIPVPSYFGGM